MQAGPRNIKDGSRYNTLIDAANGEIITLNPSGGVDETVKAARKVVALSYMQVDDLAFMLKGKSEFETCKNIFEFAYNHLQYKLDRPGIEELRTPARSWKDGQIEFKQKGNKNSGIDCDDYSIFIAALLHNVGIRYDFRIAEYNNKGYYQHIYPIAYVDGKPVVIDAVVDKFNWEKNPTKVKDFKGTLGGLEIQMLSGADDVIDDFLDIESDDERMLSAIEGLSGSGDVDTVIKNHIIKTRNLMNKRPDLFKVYLTDPSMYVRLCDKLIAAWDSENRDEILDKIVAIEDKMIANGFIRPTADTLEGLGNINELGGWLKRARRWIKKKAKKAGKGIKKFGRKAWNVVKRFNPATIIIRNGVLAFLKLNLFKVSEKFLWSYIPKAKALELGVDAAKYDKAVKGRQKLEKMFTKIGGKKKNIKKQIFTGKHGKYRKYATLSGVEDLRGMESLMPVVQRMFAPILKEIDNYNVNDIRKYDFQVPASEVARIKKEIEAEDKLEQEVVKTLLSNCENVSTVLSIGLMPEQAAIALGVEAHDYFNIKLVLKQFEQMCQTNDVDWDDCEIAIKVGSSVEPQIGETATAVSAGAATGFLAPIIAFAKKIGGKMMNVVSKVKEKMGGGISKKIDKYRKKASQLENKLKNTPAGHKYNRMKKRYDKYRSKYVDAKAVINNRKPKTPVVATPKIKTPKLHVSRKPNPIVEAADTLINDTIKVAEKKYLDPLVQENNASPSSQTIMPNYTAQTVQSSGGVKKAAMWAGGLLFLVGTGWAVHEYLEKKEEEHESNKKSPAKARKPKQLTGVEL